ncbi:MAG: NAD(P)-dependent oxidoreductase [Clostridiales bacterium]|jgi:nucleoside-diphosphate-sugar epimerase|nr:NAD(P)-dependent oxidoreductase [Clostridiales bacterium]
MRVLVTGVNGRLGKWLVRDLAANGHEPVLFTRKPVSEPAFAGYQQIRGDVNSLSDCVAAMQGQKLDAIVHPAAIPSPTDTVGTDKWKDLATCELTMKTNIMGLYNMLQGALRSDIGIFIQTGSNCATGHGFRISGTDFPIRYLPIDEEHPVDVEDSYSYSKFAGELLLDSYARSYGIRCYAVRSGWILDEEMRKKFAPRFAEPVKDLFSVLNPWVSFEDCSLAHVRILEKAALKELPLYAAYYCHADDTNASEPTIDIIKKFRPDLLSRLKSPLPGYAPFMSNQKLKDHTGWTHNYTWRKEIL